MTANQIIEALGGTGATAEFCVLNKSTISGWRKRGIPRLWRFWIQQKRPDIFVTKRAKGKQ